MDVPVFELDFASTPLQVACGMGHTVAASGGGDLYVWGSGRHGQLGIGAARDERSPVLMENMKGKKVVQVSAGNFHTAVLVEPDMMEKKRSSDATGRRVYIWGLGVNGRLGTGQRGQQMNFREDEDDDGVTGDIDTDSWKVLIPTFVEFPADIGIKRISCGAAHSAAITDAGDVYCWGLGNHGNLGYGGTADRYEPTLVDTLVGKNVVDISCGSKHTMCLTSKHEVYTWGHGGNGRLGHGDSSGQLIPKRIELLNKRDVTFIAAGEAHSACLTAQNAVYTWGAGSYGRLGHGEETDAEFPREVDLLRKKKVLFIACGAFHSLAITVNGDLYSWGGGQYGKLGLGGTDMNFTTPQLVISLRGKHVNQVACGTYHSMAVAATGELFTWGFKGNGRLGHNDNKSYNLPKVLKALAGKGITGGAQRDAIQKEGDKKMFSLVRSKRLHMISCGALHSAGLTEGGDVYVWGEGGKGQLGQGEEEWDDQYIPITIRALTQKRIAHIACGGEHMIAISSSGDAFSWGRGSEGQLGIGSTRNVPTPTLIQSLQGKFVTYSACGENHSALVTDTGDIFTFGSADTGKLGHGTSGGSAQLLPRAVQSLSSAHVKIASCGMSHTAAVTEDGVLYTWGGGWFGRLGLGDTANVYAPRQVSDLASKVTIQVQCGSYHTVVLTDEGEVYTFGRSRYLGLGESQSDQMLPVPVGSLKRVVKIAAGEEHTLALTESGALYAWGVGKHGKLGLNDSSNQTTPVLIQDLESKQIRQIACASNHSMALNELGQLYTWGNGGSGRLGHGDTGNLAVPKTVAALAQEADETQVDPETYDMLADTNSLSALEELINKGGKPPNEIALQALMKGEDETNHDEVLAKDEENILASLADLMDVYKQISGNDAEELEFDYNLETAILGKLADMSISTRIPKHPRIPREVAANRQHYELIFSYLQTHPCYLVNLASVLMGNQRTRLARIICSLFGAMEVSRQVNLFLVTARNVVMQEMGDGQDPRDVLDNPLSIFVVMYRFLAESQQTNIDLLKQIVQFAVTSLLEIGDFELEFEPMKVAQEIGVDTKNQTSDRLYNNKRVRTVVNERISKLMSVSEGVLDICYRSVNQFSPEFRWLCRQVRSIVREKYFELSPLELDTVVAGLIFSKIIITAICYPDKVSVDTSDFGPNQRQNLIHVAAAISKVVAGVPFSEKGQYAQPLNKFVLLQRDKLSNFIAEMTLIDDFIDNEILVDIFSHSLESHNPVLSVSLVDLLTLHSLLLKYERSVKVKADDPLFAILHKLGDPIAVTEEMDYKVNLKLTTRFLRTEHKIALCSKCHAPLPPNLAPVTVMNTLIRHKVEPEDDIRAVMKKLLLDLPMLPPGPLVPTLQSIQQSAMKETPPNFQLANKIDVALARLREMEMKDLNMDWLIGELTQGILKRKEHRAYLDRMLSSIERIKTIMVQYQEKTKRRYGTLNKCLVHIQEGRANEDVEELALKANVPLHIAEAKFAKVKIKGKKDMPVDKLPEEVKLGAFGMYTYQDLKKRRVVETLNLDKALKSHAVFYFSSTRSGTWDINVVYKNQAALASFSITHDALMELKRTASSASTRTEGPVVFSVDGLVSLLNDLQTQIISYSQSRNADPRKKIAALLDDEDEDDNDEATAAAAEE